MLKTFYIFSLKRNKNLKQVLLEFAYVLASVAIGGDIRTYAQTNIPTNLVPDDAISTGSASSKGGRTASASSLTTAELQKQAVPKIVEDPQISVQTVKAVPLHMKTMDVMSRSVTSLDSDPSTAVTQLSMSSDSINTIDSQHTITVRKNRSMDNVDNKTMTGSKGSLAGSRDTIVPDRHTNAGFHLDEDVLGKINYAAQLSNSSTSSKCHFNFSEKYQFTNMIFPL